MMKGVGLPVPGSPQFFVYSFIAKILGADPMPALA